MTVSETPQLVRLLRRLAGVPMAVVVMTGLTLLSSALNYSSSLVFSRLLTPESFGDLTALLAFAVVVAVPTGAAQTVVAARVSAYNSAGEHGRIRYMVRYAVVHMALIATLATLVYVAAIPLVEKVLSLQALGPALALTPLIWLAFTVPIVLGVLQGLDRYIAFGVMSLAIALSRLVFGIPLTYVGGGAGGALAGQAIGNAIVLVVAAYLLRHLWLHRGTGAGRAGLRRKPNLATVSAGGAFVGFAVLSNLDIVLAKVFLEPRAVGLYAALATIAKILIFLPGAIAVVLVPHAARAGADQRQRSRVLRGAALAVMAATLLVTVPMALMPKLTLRLMFGHRYEYGASGVLPMLLAGAGLALLYLLVVFSVTIEDRRWMLLLGSGVVLQAIGITLFHESPAQIALVQACVVGSLLLANEMWFHPLLHDRAQT